MSCCDYCNFKHTPDCKVEKIWEKFESGEITEEEAIAKSQEQYIDCEDDYHDHQIDEGERRNG